MNATSRIPRLKVVERKKSSRQKSRDPSSSAKKRPLTDLEQRDADGLNRVIADYNNRLGLEGRAKIGAAQLARMSAALGGSSFATQWTAYLNSRRAIPWVDKLIVSLKFPEYSPCDIFPSLIPFAEVMRRPARPSEVPVQRGALEELLDMILAANDTERAQILIHVRKMRGGSA
jgi:hypothetical protein